MKAIETHYKGYRFRSRLEARWAVFFDALGASWDYEQEGLDIDGHWYLPDFWFPTLECFGEVKPDTLTQKDFSLAVACRSILLVGTPDVKGYRIPHEHSCYACYRSEIAGCGTCEDHKCINRSPYGGCANYGNCRGNENLPCETSTTNVMDLCSSFLKGRVWMNYGEDYDDPRFLHAVYAARGARFDHGEQG